MAPTKRMRPSRLGALVAALVGLAVVVVPGSASAVGPQIWTFDGEPVGAVPARCRRGAGAVRTHRLRRRRRRQ